MKEKEEDLNIIKEKSFIIEYALGCIHAFIDTNRFDTFYAWDRGVFLRYEWNEDLEEYEPVHIVKEAKEGNKQYVLEHNIFPTIKQ